MEVWRWDGLGYQLVVVLAKVALGVAEGDEPHLGVGVEADVDVDGVPFASSPIT